MNKSILTLLTFLFFALLLASPLVFAEEGGVGGVKPTDINISDEPNYNIPQDARQTGDYLFLTLSLFSIIFGIFITRYFIRNSEKQQDIIKISLSVITGVLIIITLAKLIYYFGTSFSNIFIGVLLILSITLMITSFLKKDFVKTLRYTISLYTGGLIIFLLILISSIIQFEIYPPNPGYVILIIQDLITLGGVILSGILLVIGFIIDKKRK
jgi:cytochrome c oxidase subunit IV